jgi:hypothetical protein
MNSIHRSGRFATRLAACLLAGLTAGCGIDKQTPPDLSGPSEFAASITLTAAPDVLSRDGESTSTITLVARDAGNGAITGLPLMLSLSPVNGGTLSAGQVVTDGNGRATFTFTSPSVSTPVDSVLIGATPVGDNFVNAVMRQVSVALNGPTSASATFTVSPVSPKRFETTTLDASGSRLNGDACNSNCTYAWQIGSEATLTGQAVTYKFQQAQTYTVTLTVTAPGGVQTTTQQSVVVTAATNPTAVITVSPTNAKVGDQIFLSGSSSTAAQGASIAEYTWDFGDGNSATGASVTHTFPALVRTWIVRLTVRDSNGLTGTTTTNVQIAAP